MQHHQCMGYAMQHKTDTTAAVQVRLRGSILIEIENWRRAQPAIPSKAKRSGSCLSALSPAIDLSRAGQGGHDWPAHNDQRRWLTRPTIH
jgi:hypothetical protein